MGDLQIGELFQDRCFITVLATGLPAAGLADITMVIIDELGNRAAGIVTEQSNGWYTSPFTPDAAGTWAVEWSKTANPENYVFHYPYKEFKVGGGEVTDIAADAVLLKADLGDASASTLGSVYGILGNPAATSISTDVAAVHTHMDVVVADTPYIADAALPAAPTAGSLGSRFTGAVVLETTIGVDDRSTTTCRLAAGSDNNNMYVNMLAVLDSDAGDFEYVSRTITAYTGATKKITFTPALTEDAHQGGKIWIVSNDTKINVTADAVLADTNELQTDWANGGRLDLLIDAIKVRTDNRLQTVTFFSPPVTEIVADTSHTDAALPTVTIPNWTGTIAHVYAGFKFRMIENTNAAVNKLSGAQEIQINKAGGAWTDAINFVDDQFSLAASTREGGDVVMGIIDLVGTIDVFNTTAQFQWDEPLTDQDAIHFNDVQTFVIIQYY